MAQTLLEMAKELVTELIKVHHLSAEEVHALLMSTHITLQSLQQAEVSASVGTDSATHNGDGQAEWKHSISKYAIICLECGQTFRQLSSRHLRLHSLDAKAYRIKYGIPRTQPLSSRQATARRREIAHQIRPWKRAALKRESAKVNRTRGTRQASRV